MKKIEKTTEAQKADRKANRAKLVAAWVKAATSVISPSEGDTVVVTVDGTDFRRTVLNVSAGLTAEGKPSQYGKIVTVANEVVVTLPSGETTTEKMHVTLDPKVSFQTKIDPPHDGALYCANWSISKGEPMRGKVFILAAKNRKLCPAPAAPRAKKNARPQVLAPDAEGSLHIASDAELETMTSTTV